MREGGGEKKGTSCKFGDVHGMTQESWEGRWDHLPHNLRALSGQGVLVCHPINNSEELLSRAISTDGRIPLLPPP